LNILSTYRLFCFRLIWLCNSLSVRLCPIFYNAAPEDWKNWEKLGVLAVDMESYALYCNANYAGVNAITILTVSDSFHFKEITTPKERQNSFTTMMKLALEIA